MNQHRRLSFLQRQLINLCRTNSADAGVPSHVAFVMDGNRRFAKQHRLSSVVEGHSLGFDSLMFILECCLEFGIKTVTVYAFSEENFSRPPHEVEGIMNLAFDKFLEFLDKKHIIMEEGIVVNVWGRMNLVPRKVRNAATKVVLETRNNPGKLVLNICFAYSGKEEIAMAMRTVSRALKTNALEPEDVTMDLLTRCTYLRNASPPDLLIRTSGECRLSDFMLWHLHTTKLCFVDCLWPDLSIWHLLGCVFEWQVSIQRHRRKPVPQSSCSLRIERFWLSLEAERIKTWESFLDT